MASKAGGMKNSEASFWFSWRCQESAAWQGFVGGGVVNYKKNIPVKTGNHKCQPFRWRVEENSNPNAK